MARPAPQNPELLAATVAALRAAAEGRAGDEFERSVTTRMSGAGIDAAAASAVLKHWDRLNPAMRRAALGEFADRPVTLQPREAAPDGEPTRDGRFGAETRGGGGLVMGGGAAEGGGTSTSGGGRRIGLPEGWEDRIREMITADEPPSYTVTFQGMVCQDETNWDGFSNSDESYAVTTAVHYEADGSNVVRAETHPVDKKYYSDVDRREERIGPVAACWEGARVPMSLTVVAFEHDQGDPDAYRDEIKAIVAAAAAVIGYLYAPGVAASALIAALSPLIVDAINWLFDTDDDQIDVPRTEVFDVARFEELGRHAPSPYIYTWTLLGAIRTINTNLYGHFFSHHSGSGAKYVFGFQISRSPAFVVEEGPFL